MMDEEVFHVPINGGCQNLTVTDETYSHSNSVSVFPSNLFDPSNQDQIMPRYPLHSMVQGDTMNDLHACLLSSNHAGFSESEIRILGSPQLCRNTSQDTSSCSPCPVSGPEVQSQIMAGTPISTASLAMLWAANCEARENSNNIAALAPTECPVEALKDSASNEYSDTLNCAFGTSLDSEYDGIPGDLSSKWYFNKSLAPLPLAGTDSERIGLQPFQFTGNMSSSGWIPAKHMSSSSHSGVSRFSNELSLSLATCQPSIVCEPTITDQCSDISYSGVTSHYFCERGLGSTHASSDKNNPSGFVLYKPVQLPQLLSGSRFLHVMQEILAEIASYSLETFDQMSYTCGSTAAGANILFSSSHAANRGYSAMHCDDLPDEDGRFEIQMDPTLQVPGFEVNKKHLLSLLQVVDDRYNQCLDEIHTVVCAFHAVTELDPQIHASFALQTLSFLYKNLRERISNYILAIGAQLRRGGTREQERSLETSFIHQQWALQQLRRKEHQLWRPQRGLPERSVSVLRAWMFQNFLHPYPKDTEKHLLAVKSGLTRSQVSNWFINARVRLWKPMIEEMYAEMNKRKNFQKGEEANSNHRNMISIDNQRCKLS